MFLHFALCSSEGQIFARCISSTAKNIEFPGSCNDFFADDLVRFITNTKGQDSGVAPGRSTNSDMLWLPHNLRTRAIFVADCLCFGALLNKLDKEVNSDKIEIAFLTCVTYMSNAVDCFSEVTCHHSIAACICNRPHAVTVSYPPLFTWFPVVFRWWCWWWWWSVGSCGVGCWLLLLLCASI